MPTHTLVMTLHAFTPRRSAWSRRISRRRGSQARRCLAGDLRPDLVHTVEGAGGVLERVPRVLEIPAADGGCHLPEHGNVAVALPLGLVRLADLALLRGEAVNCQPGREPEPRVDGDPAGRS